MSDLNCPYCDAENEICHDDGFGYEEGVRHEMECRECDKNFIFETAISFSYEPEKADCLNDGEHDLKMSCTAPIEYTDLICNNCDHREKPKHDDLIAHIKKIYGERNPDYCSEAIEVVEKWKRHKALKETEAQK